MRLRRVYARFSVHHLKGVLIGKRAYYLEYPDKGIAVVLVDDGEKQAIMTAEPEYYRFFVQDYAESDFDVVGLRSSLVKDEAERRPKARLWHNIETGERVPAPLSQPWRPLATA